MPQCLCQSKEEEVETLWCYRKPKDLWENVYQNKIKSSNAYARTDCLKSMRVTLCLICRYRKEKEKEKKKKEQKIYPEPNRDSEARTSHLSMDAVTTPQEYEIQQQLSLHTRPNNAYLRALSTKYGIIHLHLHQARSDKLPRGLDNVKDGERIDLD